MDDEAQARKHVLSGGGSKAFDHKLFAGVSGNALNTKQNHEMATSSYLSWNGVMVLKLPTRPWSSFSLYDPSAPGAVSFPGHSKSLDRLSPTFPLPGNSIS